MMSSNMDQGLAMAISERQLEQSSLSDLITREGITVEVLIYCFADGANEWPLEVVDQAAGSAVWKDSFFTDKGVHQVFLHAVAEGGMSQFLEPGETLH